jgi:hypothetical protein
MRAFVMSELHAGSLGMRCEHPGCPSRTFAVYLDKADEKKLPLGTTAERALAILQNRLGRALCEAHTPKGVDAAEREGPEIPKAPLTAHEAEVLFCCAILREGTDAAARILGVYNDLKGRKDEILREPLARALSEGQS